MLHFATREAAEQAVFLLNGCYSEQLGRRLLLRRAELATARAIAANKAASEAVAVAVAMGLESLRLQEQAAPKPRSPTTLRPPPART